MFLVDLLTEFLAVANFIRIIAKIPNLVFVMPSKVQRLVSLKAV